MVSLRLQGIWPVLLVVLTVLLLAGLDLVVGVAALELWARRSLGIAVAAAIVWAVLGVAYVYSLRADGLLAIQIGWAVVAVLGSLAVEHVLYDMRRTPAYYTVLAAVLAGLVYLQCSPATQKQPHSEPASAGLVSLDYLLGPPPSSSLSYHSDAFTEAGARHPIALGVDR